MAPAVGGGRRQPQSLRAQLPEKTPDQRAPFPWRVVAVVLFLGVLVMYSALWLLAAKPVGVAMVEIPLLMLVTTPLFIRASRAESRFDLGGLLAVGLALRFAAAYYRFTNGADGLGYTGWGAELAKSYRHLNFGVDPQFPVPGTGGMRIIAGLAEVLTNSNAFATYLLFSWLGFLGCYLMFRALVTALPNADRRRYALLVMLWPSLIFWPSSVGKDCWLLFTVGIAALGAARVLVRKPGGYTLLAVGLLAGSFVRPHVTLLFLVAFAAALLVGRRDAKVGALTPGSIAKIAGVIVLLVLGAVLATRTASLLQANDISGGGGTVINLSTQTGVGNSAFSAPNPQNPVGYVEAVVTVTFRPFLFEAHGTDMLATSVEGIFLLGLCAVSWRRLASIPRRLRSEPYVLLSVVFVFVFIFAFGTVSNFGLLARERIAMMPFLFVLLSLNVLPRREPSRPVAAGGRRTLPGRSRPARGVR